MIDSNGMIAGLSWIGIVVMFLLWIGVFQFVVWLIGLPRSIAFIKIVHTVVFVVLSGVLAVLLYEVIFNRVTLITWIAVTLFLAEGVILLINGGRCPLTSMAENLGSSHGQITDTLLPKWFANQIFRIYGVLYAGVLVLLATRLLQ